MSWRYSYDPSVQQQLLDAVTYFLITRPESTAQKFLGLVDETFELALQFPQAKPIVDTNEDGISLRRVNAWHYAFLYRIEEGLGLLVIERIFHERSDPS